MLQKLKIAISNHRAELGKIECETKEEEKILYGKFNGTFENVELFPSQLLDKIKEGYAYTPQHKRYRHSDNFIVAQHIALDLDTKDQRSTFEYLMEDEFIRNNATFMHTTPSHTEAEPKCRVVFILDRPIYDKDKYAELTTALVEQYSVADGQCKDPGRFFWGAKGCDTKWIGNSLSLETAGEVLVKPARLRWEQIEREEAQARKRKIIVVNAEVPEKTLEKHSNSLLQNVVNAPDGEKYTTLRDTAATFGGYIAGGYYKEDEVIQWLKNAIRQNGNNVESMKHADDTIIEAVTFGINRGALHFEKNRDGDTVGKQKLYIPELDNVNPPLTSLQKAQVVDIISEREYKLYHKYLMTHDINVGYPPHIVEHFMLGYREKSVDEDGVIIENALTVPYYMNTDVVGLEYISDNQEYEYDGSVGLYYVKPVIEEESSNFGLILPNSINAIDFYLSGDGSAEIYGLPHTGIELDIPDKDLYCIITGEGHDLEKLHKLNNLGVKFIKVRDIKNMIDMLSRTEIERIATRGMKLESVI